MLKNRAKEKLIAETKQYCISARSCLKRLIILPYYKFKSDLIRTLVELTGFQSVLSLA